MLTLTEAFIFLLLKTLFSEKEKQVMVDQKERPASRLLSLRVHQAGAAPKDEVSTRFHALSGLSLDMMIFILYNMFDPKPVGNLPALSLVKPTRK